MQNPSVTPQMRNEHLVTPVFKTVAIQNMAKSREAARPIYDDVEMVEIRLAADPLYKPAYPAHSFWRNINGIPHTYAMRWPEQYKRFKDGGVQAVSGTPLEELPFLTAAKRSELKALSIYTAETLAAIDGQNMKRLGIGGRELSAQAKAYLDNASGSADFTRLAKDNAELREEMQRMQEELRRLQVGAPVIESAAPEPDAPTGYEDWTVDELKAFIADRTGKRPVGNPSRETLVRMASEMMAEAA